MTDRSSRREVRNPILGLPAAVEALRSLDREQRAALRIVLLAVREQMREKEVISYRKRKGPMVEYYMSGATYAKHIANVLGMLNRGERRDG
ncbi:hypothetical protein [Sphingomonas sp. OTU376]|uniref:hypothetical protein n=1 Tax=Sphingomonas sp. OTU376 TaxID=3043863 RepID=UPI00313D1EA2